MARNKNHKNKTTRTLLIVFAAIVAVALIAVTCVFGRNAYQNHQANKIYGPGESVGFSDFTLNVTKADVKAVSLTINQDKANKHGGTVNHENCDTLSDRAQPYTALQQLTIDSGGYVVPNPSDRVMCVRRNNSRDDIQKYSAANRQLVIDYKITASNTVETSKITLELIPDSGRKLDKRVDTFNGNEFMDTNDFTSEFNIPMVNYTPYHQSKLGDNIGKGLSRSAYVYTDVRTSEKTADLILKYSHNRKTETRIVRINLSP
jgi:hypothetical protein